jgi:hypothetical protein
VAIVNATNQGTLVVRVTGRPDETLPISASPASVVVKDYPDEQLGGVPTVRREVFGLQGLDNISDGDYLVVDESVMAAAIASNHPSKDRLLVVDRNTVIQSDDPDVNAFVTCLVRPGTGQFDPKDDPTLQQAESQAQARNRAQTQDNAQTGGGAGQQTGQSKASAQTDQGKASGQQTDQGKASAQAGKSGQSGQAAQPGQAGATQKKGNR